MKKKLYLVDASAMFFRAFYAIRPLTNSQGMPTNAIYGFLSMTIKLLKDFKPDYIAYCFDLPTPSFRKDIYPEYKANRSDTPSDLIPQIPYMKSLPELLGLPSFEKENFEADDLIGSLARYGEENNLEVIIVSGDKDFAQLVNENIKLFDPMKDITFDIAGVKNKWGVRPDQFIDFLSITGDSSDNIPGVKGIGPKGAQNLLEQFNNLEDIYCHIEQVKNVSAKKKLVDNKENAFLSKKLVKIETNINLVTDLEELKTKETNLSSLLKVLEELNFENFKKSFLLQNTLSQQGAETKSSSSDITLYESTPNEIFKSLEINSCMWIIKINDQIYICSDNNKYSRIENVDELNQIVEKHLLSIKGFDLKKVFKKINFCHNVKTDIMLSAYVLKAGNIKSFESLCQEYLSTNITPETPVKDLISYHILLENKLHNELVEKKLDQILETIELPLIEVLYEMEQQGISLDTDFLRQQSKELEQQILKIEQQIYKICDQEFNIASPKQLGSILFEKLNLPTDKKTKTGYSTDSDVLEKLKPLHPVAEKVLEFRELTKLKSTYVDALPLLVDTKTKRLHTELNQAVTTTGRLSSTNPNLQNIPIRTERGMMVRKAFIAKNNFALVSADYSQIELRVLAHITDDPGMISAFKNNFDIHAATASEVFGVSLDSVNSEQRRQAKAVNFGIAYGQGVYGLAETLGISRTEAKNIITRYFERFPGVKKYMENIVKNAYEQGYVETLIGRRRYIPEINSKNHAIKSFGERAAINAPIQGTASDIVKMAMLEIHHEFKGKMLLQVHDELLFEIQSQEVDASIKRIKNIMENCISLKVPLKVNISHGKNWSEAH